MAELIFKKESFNILGAAIEVHKTLGSGFLEQVYQEALALEFEKQSIPFKKEKKLRIKYKGAVLEKFYVADFICYDKIIVECKALNNLLPVHESQVLNYLYATSMELGLLINFGQYKIGIKRIANRNVKKVFPTKYAKQMK